MDDCIFCKMVAGEIPAVKVYEDEAVLAFLDIGPISDGHTLVIPKVHCGKVHECDPQVLADVWSRLGRIAGAIVRAMKADGYNVLCNNGRAAGQIVDHLHFHIVPRRTGDGVFTEWPAYKYPEGRSAEIAEKIRRNLT
jgi:histidine triad (HIT) family protein